MVKRVLVVGGVAGGATCAARVRRLAEDAEIVVFDRGPYVSFANCGLPYYVGNVIEDEKKLLLASAELFRARFNIEVRTENEVMSIDRERREIEVKRLGAVPGRYADSTGSPGSQSAGHICPAHDSRQPADPALDRRPQGSTRCDRRRRARRIGDGRKPYASRNLRDRS